jgi:hypothetical protein
LAELLLVVYRFLAGRPLDGVPRTDGGYLRRGRARRGASTSAWARLPGWRRQVVRLAVPAAGAGAYVAYRAAPVATVLGGAAAAAVTIWWVLRWLRRAWRSRRFRAVYIRPVLAALPAALGNAPVRLHVDPQLGSLLLRLAKPMSPAETAVRAWYGQRLEPMVRWLPDRTMRAVWALQRAARPATRRLGLLRRPVTAAGPRIELRAAVPYLTPEQRLFVGAVISAKVPAGELVEVWDQIGPKVTATWTVRRRPPARVGYADLAARFAGLQEWEFFLGLGVGGKPVTVSLQEDSPHIALSAGSGAGKSVLAMDLAVQVLARGGQVVILDRKGSHRWALGMANVDYCTRPEQMHAALVRLAKLADDRNSAALHEDEGWDPGPRVLVIAEELNATIRQLRDWWDDVREKGQPKSAPAIRALAELLYMGRSAKVHVLAIAQMLTAKAVGGPEARENFAIRCLARYTKNAWQMLVPEAAMPRASRTLGRWQIVVGGVATECQVCYLTPPEARLFVAKHTGLSPGTQTPLTAADQEMSPGQAPAGDKITLRGAVDRGLVPWQFAAAKKRLQRARAAGKATVPSPAGREGLADVYRVDELLAWVESELVS